MTGTKGMRRWARVVACASLLGLAGCPSDQPAGKVKAKMPAQATAPSITAKKAAPVTASAATIAQTPDDPAKTAKAQALVAKAQASYRSGVENYRANRLDAARMDFDAAVDLMLTSGMDLKKDPVVADAFEQLLNAVNSLEMVALKQGNGFSPKLEEAPLEAAEDLTFAPNPELTAKLKAELQIKSDLPLVINDQVAGYIGVFANSNAFRAHMVHSLERSGKYKAIIQKALADQGLPQDLFYLAVAESGFQPQALNAKSGAGGMWQFMPTGAYGLARNGYVDERFDPLKSSVAYAKYMKTVYNQLGDWFLAMAGYDWGPGNIQRVVMRTGYADFWELYRRNVLPKETKEYVPKILAAIIMAKNPAKYGLDKVVPDAPMIWDTVQVNDAIDLRLVADVTDASLPEIVALNPSLLRMTTPNDLAFDLHIPAGTHDLFVQRLKTVPEEKRTSWRFHTVRNGESLEAVAANFHARAAEIEEANDLKAGEALEEGDELVVPMAVAAAVKRLQRYTARKGDTLVTVADRFNISVEELRGWNHLKSGSLRPGQSLNISEPFALGPSMRVRRATSRSVRGRRNGSGKTATYPVPGRSAKKSSGAFSKATTRGATKSSHAPNKAAATHQPKKKLKAAR